MGTLPGNPFIWVLYLVALCALGVVDGALLPTATKAGLLFAAVGAGDRVATDVAAVVVTHGFGRLFPAHHVAPGLTADRRQCRQKRQ